jgi:hypothetical protein
MVHWLYALDGSAIVFDTDYFGKKRDNNDVFVGPITGLQAGKTPLKVWPKPK